VSETSRRSPARVEGWRRKSRQDEPRRVNTAAALSLCRLGLAEWDFNYRGSYRFRPVRS
jgi:hypothetical protein